MKKVKFISIVVCLLSVLLLANTAFAQYVQYEIIDLGTLNKGRSAAIGINDNGQIVGNTDSGSTAGAFLYEKGLWTNLGTFGGDYCLSNTASLFLGMIKPFFEQIDTLRIKNMNLRKTRDLLLPKLISRELDVENLDIKIPEEYGNA